MNILFLGTGAADWPPAPFRPDYAPGEWRGFTSTLFAGCVLIDCGPTTLAALDRFGVDPAAVTNLLITHSHGDHYCLDSIAVLASAGGLRVHADPALVAELSEIPGVQTSSLVLEKRVSVGPLLVTPVVANHSTGRAEEQAYHFLLADEAATLFYATDGAWLPLHTWRMLCSMCLDGVIWEATCADTEGDWRIFEHSSIAMVRLQRAALIKQSVLSAAAPIWLTHIARTLCSPHAPLAAALEPEGLILAHDGLHVRLLPA